MTPSQLIEKEVAAPGDWRGETFARPRKVRGPTAKQFKAE